jgi:O-antigen/teichoic acid export membrane protein
MILGGIAFAGLAICILVMPSVRALGPVLLMATVQVLSSMLSVGWFLQGLERMGAFVTASMAGRILVIPLTLLLVRSPDDVALATMIPGLCGLVSAAASFRVANRLVRLLPLRFNLKGSAHQIAAGAKLFVSTGAINLYTQTNVLILGALSGAVETGLFSGSDRIRRAAQSLIGPVGTALFPRINNLLDRDRQAAKSLMIKMLIGQGGATFAFSFIMFFLAPWGVPFALGRDFTAAVPTVQWLSPIPFLVGISNVLGVNVMLPLGMKDEFAGIVTISAIINLVAMFALCPSYGAVGAAMAALIAECFVTGAMALVLYRKKGITWIKIIRAGKIAPVDVPEI